MLVQKSFIGKLKEFGLNSYEAKLWTALLSRGVSTAGELSDIANVPRSRSYDILESLEKKGFIVMKIGKPIKYLAVHPEEVIDRVKKKVKEDAEKQVELLEEVKKKELLGDLQSLYTKGVDFINPAEITASIKGRNNIYNHMETMIKSAEKTITIVSSAKGLERKAEILKKNLKKSKDKGVKIKMIAPLSNVDEKTLKELKSVAEVYNAPELKSRFCVVDGKEVFMMLMDDEAVHPSYDVGVWLNTSLLASSMDQMALNHCTMKNRV